jgi:ketosteroid isomerase-like protein
MLETISTETDSVVGATIPPAMARLVPEAAKCAGMFAWVWPVLVLGVVCLGIGAAGCGDSASANTEPMDPAYAPVAAYLATFNAHSFGNTADFATEDWNLINPTGVWSRNRAAAVASEEMLSEVILKGVTLTVLNTSLAHVSRDVAVITLTSRFNNFMFPDEALERSTFVVVQRDGKWWLHHTHVTTILPIVDPQAGPAWVGAVPSDVGGDLESEDIRRQKARLPVDWFMGLPVSHDFDRAPDHTTDDWNLITAFGDWAKGREASLATTRGAFTTVLDGLIVTADEMVTRFPTDTVAVLTVAETVVLDDQAGNDVVSYVIVNHGGVWLAAHVHYTAVP